MAQTPRENTLLIGNGFSRSVFREVPSWGELFEGVTTSVQNYAILYEKCFLQKRREGKSEEEVKEELIKRIQEHFSEGNIRKDICNLERFGEYLQERQISNILTTNYDSGLESILCKLCGYKEEKPLDMVSEKIYSVRTYRLFVHKERRHKIKLWKIHGDLDRVRSITLGFDHYCGAMSKLSEYIKGSYRSSKSDQKFPYRGPMADKCREQTFDSISWAELFFCTNLYIVGFGLDFSEIDIWWLLNKRARMMVDIPEIKNEIIYIYNSEFESPNPPAGNERKTLKDYRAKYEALEAFGVRYCPMIDKEDYISSIFATMDQCMKEN